MAPQLLGARPHLSDPSGRAHVWFTDPPGIVDCVTGPALDVGMVDWLIGPATDALRERFPSGPAWTFLHDWREVRTYHITTRPKLVAWGLTLGKQRVGRITVVIDRDASSILRMACQAGVLPFALAGIPMQIHHDFDAQVKALGLRLAR
jgi:hypothetical protein